MASQDQMLKRLAERQAMAKYPNYHGGSTHRRRLRRHPIWRTNPNRPGGAPVRLT